MTRKVFVEIDGVLSNNNHRLDCRHAFDEYWNEALKDGIKKHVLELLQEIESTTEIILFSCRPEEMRYQTEEWIRERNIPCDDLLLRPEGDRSKEDDLRDDFVLGDGNLTKALKDTWFVMVNKESSVESLRSLGFKVLQEDWA